MFARRAWGTTSIVVAFCLASACGGAARTEPQTNLQKPQPVASAAPRSEPPKLEPTVAELADQAQSKLEVFLQRNDLDRSMRAQAMFRLAALHDDRIKEHTPGVTDHWKVAVRLYLQIIREFPDSDVFVPSHYALAYDLGALQYIRESQHIYRVLVCHNHFSFVPPKDDRAPFPVPPMPQEHDRTYWTEWEFKHTVPVDKLPKKKREMAGEELKFVNPYPDDCQPLPVATSPGHAPPYIGDAWWSIGDHHFAQLNSTDGPYNFNLAAVAYRNVIRYAETPLRNYAMYKLGWTYFKQERYAAAVEQFIEYLRYDEAHPEKPKALYTEQTLYEEAITYIAVSLLFVDFKGPGPDDPYIPREDVLDTEKDPRIAEKKVRVAIKRVQDAQIIPQNETWTPGIYAELIRLCREMTHYHNQIELSEIFLAKWPNDPHIAEIRQWIDWTRARLGKP